MKISNNNFTLWLIQSTYRNPWYLPKDLCSFFWSAVGAYLLAIPLFWWHAFKALDENVFNGKLDSKSNDIHAFGKLFISLVLFLLTSIIIYKIFPMLNPFTFGFIFTPLCLLIVIGVFVLTDKSLCVLNNINFPITTKKITNNWLIQGIKSFKEKTCKIIEYHD